MADGWPSAPAESTGGASRGECAPLLWAPGGISAPPGAHRRGRGPGPSPPRGTPWPAGATQRAGTIGAGVTLWNVATRQKVATLPGPVGYAPVAFSPDGQFLASGSGSDNRSVLLWRAATFEETDPLRVAAQCGDRSVELQW